jgi:26S proteasome regulatory subunit N5
VASSSTSKDTKGKEKPVPVTSKDHLEAAADLMTEIQVETYSSMDKREKTEFILEQMRLESLRGNWIRVRVGSRKINRVFLKEPASSVSWVLGPNAGTQARRQWSRIWH